MDYEGSQRSELDATWAEIASIFKQLIQEYEQMAVFLGKKANAFEEADYAWMPYNMGSLMKWKPVVLASLPFLPVVGHLKDVASAALRPEIYVGQKTGQERILALLQAISEEVQASARVMQFVAEQEAGKTLLFTDQDGNVIAQFRSDSKLEDILGEYAEDGEGRVFFNFENGSSIPVNTGNLDRLLKEYKISRSFSLALKFCIKGGRGEMNFWHMHCLKDMIR
ncbi:hypothetical protein [Paenibacillus faecalis]|uniref:hypothetical protein n=1 Tax=Paenibacillus faecalis TaxID=2079532 RepID=UPI000D105989|nr:hypothetical protein [Paenibacillus faecalis]